MAHEHAPALKPPAVERRAAAAGLVMRSSLPVATPVPAGPTPAAVAVASPVTLQCAKISKPSDPAEREAEQTARKVVEMSEPAKPPRVDTDEDGKKKRTVQRALSPGGPAAAPASAAPARLSGGMPLPTGVRRFMEPRFGAGFGSVRIHTGEAAAQQSAALGARAFTLGSHIVFGRNQFRPDSADGRELIAHELTHTIQQGAAIQRSVDTRVAARTGPQVQRFGIGDVLDWIADKANYLPGFRLFTLVLGINPINMAAVARTGANILRALLELVPVVGPLVVQALDNYGLFDKVGPWMEARIRTLGMVGSAIKSALSRFIDSLGLSDILSPGDVWERGKRIFTEPIGRLLSFGAGLVGEILGFIRQAILLPLAKLAEGTRGYDLLKAVLGQDPVTGEPVPRTPEILIGGFLKLIGQEDIWQNMQKANAIPRAWGWFQGAMGALVGFVGEIPGLFIAALKSLEITDLLLPPKAFVKVVKVFGSFVGRFVAWGAGAAWNLLEIVFDVVSPGALAYIKKTGAALKGILKNPLPFVRNLVRAAKLGFQNFAGNFLTHLKAGLLNWLTGALPGIYIPKALSLGEIAKFAFSVLGLTWANIRGKLVKVIGEPAMKVLETSFDVVVALVRDGPAAAWDLIKEQLAKLKDMAIGAITDFVVDLVVKKAIPKLVSMFIPGAGFISAILSIYDTVMVFVNKLTEIAAVVKGFVDSIVAIAAGQVGAAAGRVEKILAGLLSLAINFLAGFAGLGKVADKVMGVIQKIRAPIDKAIDWLIGWIVKAAKALLAKVTGRANETPEQKQARLDKGAAAAQAAVNKYAGKAVGAVILKPLLAIVKLRYGLTSVEPVASGATWSVRVEVNPVKIVNTKAKVGKENYVLTFEYEPQWPLDEFKSKTAAMKRAAEKKKAKEVVEPPELKTVGSGKTKAKRKGGQGRFREEIKAFVAANLVKSAASKCDGLMAQLQADHQQELQVGGTDTAENMAMIEKSMNASLGSQLKSAIVAADVSADTVIASVKIDTSKAKAPGARQSGAARTMEGILLDAKNHVTGTISVPARVQIRSWFKLD